MLGTPPAFVLSQDQTLKKWYLKAEALKSCFKKICLANFTQEFSLAVISILHRLNNPLIVQGVLVRLTLFNLQGTGRSPRVRGESLLILAQPSSIVKHFFYLLTTYFSLCFPSHCPYGQLGYNIKYRSFCQGVFSLFLHHFSISHPLCFSSILTPK